MQIKDVLVTKTVTVEEKQYILNNAEMLAVMLLVGHLTINDIVALMKNGKAYAANHDFVSLARNLHEIYAAVDINSLDKITQFKR